MNPNLRRRQQGVVLLIALIALVVMGMSALAMYRSVDSTSSVAGNIGYRQQGVAVTDVGVEAALTWLQGANAATLEAHQAANGYYATHTQMLVNGDIFTLNWENSAFALPDENGYQMWYVIHRLCNEIGAPSPGNCPDSENTINQASIKPGIPLGTGGIAPVYRITVRALGPRRAESLVQVMTY